MFHTLSRSFRPAAWLGWQVESNWTDPLMFFAFQVLRPVASVLILVFMFRVVAGASGASSSGAASSIYAYIYLGNAFYIYVGAVMAGASYSILDDRERYRTLKYLYIAPINIPVYLFGRAVARFVTGTIAVVITILAGVLFFKVPLSLGATHWPMFFGALMLGVFCLSFMGIIIGTWTLTIRNEPWFVGDAAAAALYLFSGAVFPITILPAFLAHRLHSTDDVLAGIDPPRVVGGGGGRVPHPRRILECPTVRHPRCADAGLRPDRRLRVPLFRPRGAREGAD